MIKELTMYTVLCDRCGKDAQEGEEYSVFGDKGFAVDCAMHADWQEIGGKHYCHDCWQWTEDGEEIIAKP